MFKSYTEINWIRFERGSYYKQMSIIGSEYPLRESGNWYSITVKTTHPFCQICLDECNLLRKDLNERYSIYLIGSSHYLLILLTVSIKLSAAVRLADPTISFSVNSGGSLLIFPPISCKYQSRIISYHISPSFWSMHHKLSEYIFSILTSTCKINLKTMLVLAYSLLSLKVFFLSTPRTKNSNHYRPRTHTYYLPRPLYSNKNCVCLIFREKIYMNRNYHRIKQL